MRAIGVIRNYYIATCLKKYFSSVFVITSTNRKRLANASFDFDVGGLRVLDVFTLDYRTVRSFFNKKIVPAGEPAKKSAVWRFAAKIKNTLPFNLLIGEGGFIYIVLAFIKASRIVRSEKPAYIYTSFHPYSDIFIGYCLKRLFPGLYWIADFRDLHLEPIYQLHYLHRLQLYLNKAILRRADLVTTVSEGLAKNLTQFQENIYVLRNGFSFSENGAREEKPDYFSLVYTGSMFEEYRNPQALLEAVKKLTDSGYFNPGSFRICYAGVDGLIWRKYIRQYGLEEIFEDKGMLSRNDSLKLQRKAHVNLLLTSASTEIGGVMTSKFYEYVSARNPIVVLINGAKDPEFERIMGKLDGGMVAYNYDPDSCERLKNYLIELYDYWKIYGGVKYTISPDQLKEFEWGNLAAGLAEKILN